MNIFTSVVFGLEYLYQSAMDYLNQTYHDQKSDLVVFEMPKQTWLEIREGESAARLAAESYDGPTNGNTVI